MEGDGHRLTTRTAGEDAYWTVRPAHPIWGTRRLTIESSLPLPARGSLSFPDLTPLGRGTADAYLAVVNATSLEAATDESPGLRPIDYDGSGKFRGDLFATPRGATKRAFRMQKEGWSLRLRVPEGAVRGEPGESPAIVTLAEMSATVVIDGSVIGSAEFELQTRTSPYLSVRLPDDCGVLRSAVDEVPAQPFRLADGRWLVPLEPRGSARVSVLWRQRSGSSVPARRELSMPEVDQVRGPVLATVRVPASFELRGARGLLKPSSRDRMELERARWIWRRERELLPGLDRGSPLDRELAVAGLVAFDVALRAAERAVIWSFSRASASRDERLRRVREQVGELRGELAGEIKAAGLDDLWRSAQVHQGLARETAGRPKIEIPERAAPVRVGGPGTPSFFQAEGAGAANHAAVAYAPIPARGALNRPEDRVVVVAAILFPLFAFAVAGRVRRSAASSVVTLGLGLTALAVWAGPQALAAGLGVAALGRAISLSRGPAGRTRSGLTRLPEVLAGS
jgi:hypothetical protein